MVECHVSNIRPASYVHVYSSACVSIARNGYVIKYFKKQCLPTSNDSELLDVVTREANKAIENVI